MARQIKKLILSLILLISFSTLGACVQNEQTIPLDVPTGFNLVENYLVWQPVAHANGYDVKIVEDNNLLFVNEPRVLVLPQFNNRHISIKANPETAQYLESAWSSPYLVSSTVTPPPTPSDSITVNQPTYQGPALHYGDPLPVIHTTTTGGTISLNPNQILSVDIQSYAWTFVATNGKRVVNPTGVITLQVLPKVLTITPPVYTDDLSLNSSFPEFNLDLSDGSNIFYDRGVITIDPGQVLQEGTHSYSWTYHSQNGFNPNISISNPTGTIELTVPLAIHQLPSPEYNYTEFHIGDPLPILFLPEYNYEGIPILGTVEFDEGQFLIAGGNYYTWTFTPTNETLWSPTTGEVYVGVELIWLSISAPTYSGQLSYHDPLPILTSTTASGLSTTEFGEIILPDYQTLEIGQNDYEWVFIPFIDSGCMQESGYISLTVEKKLIILDDPTYEGPLYYQDYPNLETNAEGWFIVNYNGELNAGRHYLEWTFHPADTDHYDYINTSGVVEVNVLPLVITVNPLVSTSVTHGQTDPLLSQYYSSEFGQYHLVPGQVIQIGFHTYNWIFTPKYPYDSNNYQFINTTGTVEIQGTKASLPIPSLLISVFAYDGTLKTISLANPSLYVISGDVSQTNVGSNYTVTVEIAEPDKYLWQYFQTSQSEPKTLTWSIVKGTPDVQTPVYSQTLTYGDALPILSTTAPGTLTLDATQSLLAGTSSYTWTFIPFDQDNYELVTGAIELTVNKKAVTVAQPTYQGGTITYGDSLPQLTTTTTGGVIKLAENTVLEVLVSSYTWVFTPVDTINIEWSNLTSTINLTVQKKMVDVGNPLVSGVYHCGDENVVLLGNSLGTYQLSSGQTLLFGNLAYSWVFTPTGSNSDNYSFDRYTGSVVIVVSHLLTDAVRKSAATYSSPEIWQGSCSVCEATGVTEYRVEQDLPIDYSEIEGKFVNWNDSYRWYTFVIDQPKTIEYGLIHYWGGTSTTMTSTIFEAGTFTGTPLLTFTVLSSNTYRSVSRRIYLTPGTYYMRNYFQDPNIGRLLMRFRDISERIETAPLVVLNENIIGENIYGTMNNAYASFDYETFFKLVLPSQTNIKKTVTTGSTVNLTLYRSDDLINALEVTNNDYYFLQPGTYYFLYHFNTNSVIRIDDMAEVIPETTLGRVHPSASPYYRLVLTEDTVVAWDLISGTGVKAVIRSELGAFSQNVITSGLYLYPAGNYYVTFTGVVQSSDLTHGRVVELDENLNFSSSQKIAWMKLIITQDTYLSWKKSDNGSGITGSIYSHNNLTTTFPSIGNGIYAVTPGDYYIKQSYVTYNSSDTLILEELNPIEYTYGTTIEVEKDTYYGVAIPTWFKFTLASETLTYATVRGMVYSNIGYLEIYSSTDLSTRLLYASATSSSKKLITDLQLLPAGTYYIRFSHSGTNVLTHTILVGDASSCTPVITLGTTVNFANSGTNYFRLELTRETIITTSSTFSASLTSSTLPDTVVKNPGTYYLNINSYIDSSFTIKDSSVTFNTLIGSIDLGAKKYYYVMVDLSEDAIIDEDFTISYGSGLVRSNIYANSLANPISNILPQLLIAGRYFFEYYNSASAGYTTFKYRIIKYNLIDLEVDQDSAIEPSTSINAFRLVITQAQLLNIKIKNGGGYVYVYLVNSGLSHIMTVSSSSGYLFLPGTYYLIRSIAQFSLIVQEPDHLDTGVSTGSLLLEKNVGVYFRFDLIETTIITVVMTKISGDGINYFEILDPQNDYNIIINIFGSTGSSTPVNLAAGTYYLHLYPSLYDSFTSTIINVSETADL